MQYLFSATAQTTKTKVKKGNNLYQDSLLEVKQRNQVKTIQPGKAKVKQAPNNENIKLDDLKNPFDTNKVKTSKPLRSKN